jgi:HK97 family phage major capsid protein
MNNQTIDSTILDMEARREEVVKLLATDGPKMPKENFEALRAEVSELDDRVSKLKLLASPKKTEQPFVLGMDDKEARQYSIFKAITAIGEGTWHKEQTLERRASEAIAKRLGTNPRGFYVPMDIPMDGLRPQAAQRTTNDGAGGFLVADDLRATDFIEVLTGKLAVYRAGLGATILSGLVGNTYIPRRSAGTTAYWVAEGTGVNGLITASDSTFQQVSLTPKTVGAATEISRNLMLQGTPSAERLVRDDLLRTLALAIDSAAISGSGLANNPTGVLSAGITQIDSAGDASVPTWSDIVQLETEVATDNADMGRLGYLTHPLGRGYLKSNPMVAANDKMMWSDNDTINGYTAFVSSQVPSAITQGAVVDAYAMVFGNWADLIIGLWGGLDVVVDTSTYSLAGATRIVAFQAVDVAVRHAESFAFKNCARS